MYVTIFAGEIDQGDILRPTPVAQFLPWWDGSPECPLVVLTPACDIAQKRADFHRVGILQPFPLYFYRLCELAKIEKEHIEGRAAIGRNKMDKLQTGLRSIIRNGIPRYHFFPRSAGVFDVTDRFIDFEVVVSVPINRFEAGQRLARLASPFREELIHRYAHHTMRIGTPDLDSAAVEVTIQDCLALTKLQVAA